MWQLRRFNYPPALAATLTRCVRPMGRNILLHPLTLIYVLQVPQAGGTTEDGTKALTKNCPTRPDQLGFPEGNKFWVRCAAFYAVQP